MFFSLFLVLNYSLLVHGAPVASDENGWWDVIADHMPLWYTQDESANDNDEEIKNSVKLMELFPTIKLKLESSNEKEQEEAKEFIKKMNNQIKEKKRYTYMLWKGVKTIIDMGRVESNERRANEEQVSAFWKFIQGIIDFLKWIVGMKTADNKKDRNVKEDAKDTAGDKKEHESEEEAHMRIVPTHHKTPASDPKAGVKDNMDQFEGKAAEIIHADQYASFHVPTQHTLPPSDPQARTKDQLDKFDSSKPIEVIHDKDHASSEADKSN